MHDRPIRQRMRELQRRVLVDLSAYHGRIPFAEGLGWSIGAIWGHGSLR
jgi:hypothetical protein